jgi:predicted transcriptional regulator of viral defense system
MTAKEKLLEFAREKKIFRARDAEPVGGASSRVYLNRLLAEGKLVRAGHGLYAIADNNFTEMQDFLEVAVKVPRGVLCLLSALRFHDLTTQNPFEVWLTIENKMRIPKIETVPVN